MKRWFIARMVIDDGVLVPKVGVYPNVNFRVWAKTGFGFGMGQLATSNVTQFEGDADIKIIPDASLDNALSTIPTATRNAMIAGLTAGGFDIAAVKNTWSVRQLLQHLKLQLQTDDDIESGDVQDIAG